MTELVSFPNLGLEIPVRSILLQVGNFAIHWYGVILAIGLLAGIGYALRHSAAFGVDQDRLIDVIMVGTIGSIIGARAYYVIFSWEYYSQHPEEIIAVWKGGIAIYGAIIGALLFGIIMCYIRKLKVLPVLDLVSGGFLLGQGIGRWGNFVNVEAFGDNTESLFGMTSPKIVSYLTRNEAALEAIGMEIDPAMPVHPTFLYESLWCLAGFLFLALFLTKHRRFDGSLFLFYVGWYGFGRYNIEGLRTDSLMIGNQRVSQLLALLVFAAALVVWIVVRAQIFRKNDPDFLKLDVICQQEAAAAAAEAAAAEEAAEPAETETKPEAEIEAEAESEAETEAEDNDGEDH